MSQMSEGRTLRRANPKTIQDKFLVGYQGWFTCPGDGPPVHKGHHGWLHWISAPLADGGKPSIDLWPDVSDYGPDELFPATGFTLPNGSTPKLFSSRHPATVGRHFHWMAQHGVDGVFLQRFASQCEVDGRTTGATADLMRLRDEVLGVVRAAAEREGRVWAIMYDVGSTPPDKLEHLLRTDWAHLRNDLRILDSPNYLKEGGRPVIALWGLGFAGRSHSADLIRRIVRGIRSDTPNGAYVFAGTATHWATSQSDADPNPELLDVWFNEFDAISPWTVGRYKDDESADRFAREKIQRDLEALKNNTGSRPVDYVPVVFPGGSGHHITNGRWTLNQQPRNGGRLLWRQLYNTRKAGVRIIYGAMWDEYDEGTAFLPVVPYKRQLPSPGPFLSLDADGYDLPADWYMRICGFIAEVFHNERPNQETFPVKELQDYWSTHPKCESPPASQQAGSSSNAAGVGQSFEQWCDQEKGAPNDLPPPPYTLQDETKVIQEEASRPPLPLQTRPVSISAAASTFSDASQHGRASSLSQSSSTGPSSASQEVPPQPHFENRPASIPFSSSSSLGRSQSSVDPGEVYRPHLHGSTQHTAPDQIPWQIRPQQANTVEGTPSPPVPNSLRPSVSLSAAHGSHGEHASNLRNPWSPEDAADEQSQDGASRPPMQWPPPEWGVGRQQSPVRPATQPRPPPPRSQRPPVLPSNHPQAPAPALPYQPRIRPPHAHSPHLMPNPESPSAPSPALPSPNWEYHRSQSPFTGPGSGSGYSNTQAGYNQQYASPSQPMFQGEYSYSAGPGGFIGGPHVPHAATSPGPGYGSCAAGPLPPHMAPPPRPSCASVPAGYAMPTPEVGGLPGGFVSRFSGVALGAVDRLAGPSTRRRVEDGVDSISSASAKIYQRFR